MDFLIQESKLKSNSIDSDKISVCSSQKKLLKSCVGFDCSEIQQTPTNELKQLRSTIYSYLKSNSQKYKNQEYFNMYKRLIEELKRRENIISEKSNNSDRLEDSQQKQQQVTFLGRKKTFQETADEVEIPSFLNDKEMIPMTKKFKSDQKDESTKNEENEEKKKKIEETIQKNCIIKGKKKVLKILEFEKGLFNEKLDLSFSSDMDGMTLKKDSNKERESLTKKEVEISGTMFDTLAEDMFFTLD